MLYDSMNAANARILPRIDGVVVGLVTNNKDPDNKGRVKVKIPMLTQETESDWVRIAQPMAGKENGTLIIPEVNDEVLIAFQLGDISQPFIVGSLWNDKNKPPAGKDDKNNVRKIVSRAGHELTFSDKQGDESVSIVTKKGLKLEMTDKDETIKLQDKPGTNAVTIKGGSSGEIEIKSGTTKITINNKGDATVESTKKLTLKSTEIAIEATAKLSIKGGAMVDIASDGMLNLKGSMVKIN